MSFYQVVDVQGFFSVLSEGASADHDVANLSPIRPVVSLRYDGLLFDRCFLQLTAFLDFAIWNLFQSVFVYLNTLRSGEVVVLDGQMDSRLNSHVDRIDAIGREYDNALIMP